MTLFDLLIIAAIAGVAVCVSAASILGWLLYRDLTRGEVEYEVDVFDDMTDEQLERMADLLRAETRVRR